jgi:hypothetical protein
MYFVGAVLQGTHPRGEVEDKTRTDLNRYRLTLSAIAALPQIPLIQAAPPSAGGSAAASAGERTHHQTG